MMIDLVKLLIRHFQFKIAAANKSKIVPCALKIIHAAALKSGLHKSLWICGGAVLGMVREQGLIECDPDIDFHYDGRQSEEMELFISELLKNGFKKLYRYTNNDGVITTYCFTYRGMKFDFFSNDIKEDGVYWYTYIKRHIKRPKRQFLNKISPVELEPVLFMGFEFNMPKDKERYLSDIYGDWHVPRPDYTFYIDSRAIIESKPWTGSKEW